MAELLRVLLVEPDEHEFVVTATLLSVASYARFIVSRVETVKRAVERLEIGGFDVVLVSAHQSDGVDTYMTLADCAPGIPIVILTDLAGEAAGCQAMKMGAQDCLVKGEFDEHVLSRALYFAFLRVRSNRAGNAPQLER